MASAVHATMPPGLDGLRVIALLKCGKAVLLLFAAVGTHLLIQPSVVTELYSWSSGLADGYERALLQRLLLWLTGPGHVTMSKVEYLTFVYLAVVLVEAVGLWQRKLWAEWLVILAGAGLIPFEIWKLLHPSDRRWMLLLALLLNLAVVGYLAARLQQRIRRRHLAHAAVRV